MFERRISRRRVLGYGSAGVAMLAAGPLAIACGDDDDDDDAAVPTGSPTGTQSGGGATSSPAASATQGVQTGGTLEAAMRADPVNFDYQLSQAFPSHGLASIYAQTLLRFRSDGDPLDSTVEPYLADSWEQQDETTFTIRLRSDANWHDVAPVSGRTVDAEDVEKTFSRLLDPATESPLIKIVGEFIDKIETPDATTVTISFKDPFVAFPYQLAAYFLWMMPRESAAGEVDPKETMIGSGPFVAADQERGVRYTFARSQNYWGKGEPLLDTVNMSIITDAARFFTALSTGSLHIGDVDSRDLETFQKTNSGAVVESYPVSGRRELNLVPHPGNELLQDQRVRQAILRSIDQDAIIERAYRGDGAFSGLISPSSPKWALDESENRSLYGRNVQDAKDLLSAAGFSDGIDVQINFTLQHGQVMADIAEMLSSQLSEAGINLRIQQMEYTEFVSNLYSWNHNGIAFTPSLANFGADPQDWLYKGMSVNGLYNFSQGPATGGWADPQLQELVTRQYQEFDEESRIETTHAALRRAAELAITIPTGAWNVHHAHDEKLSGYHAHNSGLAGSNLKLAHRLSLSS